MLKQMEDACDLLALKPLVVPTGRPPHIGPLGYTAGFISGNWQMVEAMIYMLEALGNDDTIVDDIRRDRTGKDSKRRLAGVECGQ